MGRKARYIKTRRKIKYAKPRGCKSNILPHVAIKIYLCPECRLRFERVVLKSDNGETVIKHWSRCCSGCGNKRLRVVGESDWPLDDGNLFVWDEREA